MKLKINGNLIPDMVVFLDRFDGIIFIAPIVFYLVSFLVCSRKGRIL